MEKFLKQVASYLAFKYQNHLENLTIVFPNRRSGLFFQKYLSELLQQPQISPRILTINELIGEFSTLQLVDSQSAVFNLYKVFCNEMASNEPFDEFYYWGEMLLNDFNDIDKYLVDPVQLFRNINDLKEIELEFDFLTAQQHNYLSSFWNHILFSRDSEAKKHFLKIWQKLPSIYTELHHSLLETNCAYEGMLYRHMVQSLKENPPEISANSFCVIGFNALNACEKKLFDFLSNAGGALFFWDYDSYYMDMNVHEAAYFMHDNVARYPLPADFHFYANNFSKLKQINAVAIPGKTGQSVYVSQWLSDIKEEFSPRFDNTAIVLCDETLLTSVLNAVPSAFSQVNVTMGYPLKGTLAASLLKGLVSLDKNARNTNDETIFYYRNVLSFLNHPLLKPIFSEETERLTKEIQVKNKIYLSSNDFVFSEKLVPFFRLPELFSGCKDYLQFILLSVFEKLPNDAVLEKETIYQIFLLVNRLHDSLLQMVQNDISLISKRMFYQLLMRQIDGLSVPFEGEPLAGLQIMGFLETRCLDFDHVIFVSTNDDKLPGKVHNHSFIPYSLRKGYGLPVSEQRHAMYAYYFYRMIQRAKKVTILYDSRTEGMNRGEISRYANQLKYEAQHIHWKELKAVFDHDLFAEKEIVVTKNEMNHGLLIEKLTGKLLTPSALNQYLDCSLKFYFRYVEEAYDVDEVLEEMDNLVFGRIAHVALEEIYKPYVGKEISKSLVEHIIQDELAMRKSLSKALMQEFFKGSPVQLTGNNLLAYDIIYKYLKKILDFDLSLAPFVIIGLEKKYEAVVSVTSNEMVYRVKIGGTIDRIDKVRECIRVVDYKTGKSDNTVSNIPSLIIDKRRNKAAFQTMLYAWCVYQTERPAEKIMPAVYGARSVFQTDFSPFFTMEGKDLELQENAMTFIENVQILLAEILNKNEPFVQTKDKTKCSYCPYNEICRR